MQMLVETCMCLLSLVSVSCLLVFWGSLTAAKLNTFAGLRLNKSNCLLVYILRPIGKKLRAYLTLRSQNQITADQFHKFCKSTKT